MATIREVREGLEILEKYDQSKYPAVGAEHDAIYACHNADVSDEDRAKLDDLGWCWDDEVEAWRRFT